MIKRTEQDYVCDVFPTFKFLECRKNVTGELGKDTEKVVDGKRSEKGVLKLPNDF